MSWQGICGHQQPRKYADEDSCALIPWLIRFSMDIQMSAIVASGLTISKPLYDFVINEALPGTGVSDEAFFAGLAGIVDDLGPRNLAMLVHRDELQKKIDAWHKGNPGPVDLSLIHI